MRVFVVEIKIGNSFPNKKTLFLRELLEQSGSGSGSAAPAFEFVPSSSSSSSKDTNTDDKKYEWIFDSKPIGHDRSSSKYIPCNFDFQINENKSEEGGPTVTVTVTRHSGTHSTKNSDNDSDIAVGRPGVHHRTINTSSTCTRTLRFRLYRLNKEKKNIHYQEKRKGLESTITDDFPLHKWCYYSVKQNDDDLSKTCERGDATTNIEESTKEQGERKKRKSVTQNEDYDKNPLMSRSEVRKKIFTPSGREKLLEKDGEGRTPLHILCIASRACPKTYIMNMWREEKDAIGTEEEALAVVNDDREDPEHMTLLQLIYQANPSAATMQDNHGKCPIHYAVDNIGFPWFLHPLARATVKRSPTNQQEICAASIPDKEGKTALHYLASNPYVTPRYIQSLYKIYPAAATMQDKEGNCPIHYAVTNECASIKNFIDILATAKTPEAHEAVISGTSSEKPAARIYNLQNETATTIAIQNETVPLDLCVYLYSLYPVLRREIRLKKKGMVPSSDQDSQKKASDENQDSLNYRFDQVIDAYIRQFDASNKVLQATKLEQEGFVRHITNLYRKDDEQHLKQWIMHVEDVSKFPIRQLKEIAAFCGSNGRTLAEYAPPRIKQAITKRTAFLQRFQLKESPPLYMSQKSIILKAYDLNSDEHYRNHYETFVEKEKLGDRGLDKHDLSKLVQRVFLVEKVYSDIFLKKYIRNEDGFMKCEEFVSFCKEVFDRGHKRTVALKLMSDERKFEKELKIRKEFESNHEFLSIMAKIDDSYYNISKDEISKVLSATGLNRSDLLAKAYHVHAMPCGDRSLETIFRLEQPNLNQVRGYCEQIAKNLKIVHEHGVCCGNLKLGDIVRFNGELKLTDLTASTRKLHGDGSTVNNNQREAKYYVGSRFTPGVLPPEMIHSLDRNSSKDKEYKTYMEYFNDVCEKDPKLWEQAIKPRQKGSTSLVIKTFLTKTCTKPRHGYTRSFLAIKGEKEDFPYSPILASEAIDLWSFGLIMYTLLTGKPLFDVDSNDAFKSFESMNELATWTDGYKMNRLDDVDDSVAKDLLAKLLSRDPKKRGSFREVLKDSFFSNKGALNDAAMEKLNTIIENQMVQMDTLKKINTATKKIDQKIDESSQSIMKAVFESTEVITPTCFILRPKGDDGEGVAKTVERTGTFLAKVVKSFNTITALVTDPNKEHLLDVAGIFAGDQHKMKVKYSLYLIDEYTGQTVDPPYEVTLDGEDVAEFLPIMANGWRAVKTFNEVAGFTKAFFPIMPTIPAKIVKDIDDVIGVLASDHDLVVDEPDSVDDDLMVEASKSGEKMTVRGAKLRKFEKFLIEIEDEQNLNFADLIRVNDNSGNAIWITEESYQYMQMGVKNESLSPADAASSDLEDAMIRLKAVGEMISQMRNDQIDHKDRSLPSPSTAEAVAATRDMEDAMKLLQAVEEKIAQGWNGLIHHNDGSSSSSLAAAASSDLRIALKRLKDAVENISRMNNTIHRKDKSAAGSSDEEWGLFGCFGPLINVTSQFSHTPEEIEEKQNFGGQIVPFHSI